jgi:hypothetical protein
LAEQIEFIAECPDVLEENNGDEHEDESHG